MEVKSKALPLLAISDHAARKTNSIFGALIGYRHPESIVVSDAFELKHQVDLIDMAHFETKLALLKTNSPSVGFVGLYCIEENGMVPLSMQLQFYEAGFSDPLVFLTPFTDKAFFRCLLLGTSVEFALKLTPGESEVTAVSTVQNHANYSQKETDLVNDADANFGSSLAQLQDHVRAILADENSNKLNPDVEQKVVHLAQLVLNYKGEPPADSFQLHASYLSLLESQIAASKCANTQIKIRTSVTEKRFRSRAEPWKR